MKTLLILITLCLLNVSAIAQEKGVTSLGVDQERISELVDTLEDPEARDKFINNLKTLTEATEEDVVSEEGLVKISDTLGLDNTVYTFIKRYEAFLDEYNLNGSTFGKLMASVMATIIAIGLLVFVRKLGFLLRARVIQLNTKHKLSHQRLRLYSRLMRYMGYVLAILLYIYTLNVIWGVAEMSFLENDRFGTVSGNMMGLILVFVIAVAIWEAISAYLEGWMNKAGELESKRLQTLLPLLRNVFFVVFLAMFSLVALSELGINIVPLLAGAGVLGIAIGFGAQSMVKDFLTGFTIILEDLIQVGDAVELAGHEGFIEKITIRKVQMRNLDGVVITVPFSEINIVKNLTKEFSVHVFDLGVAYREDVDAVTTLIYEVGESLRVDEYFGQLILEPVEVLGLDQFADSAVVIRGRFKTQPLKQWIVAREFNRRIKYKFDEHGIEIPFPHQTLYFGEDKKGNAPAASIRIEEKQ